MGAIAAIVGAIGGLLALMGIVTAFGVSIQLGADVSSMFWLVLSVIFLLGAIALSMGRGGGVD